MKLCYRDLLTTEIFPSILKSSVHILSVLDLQKNLHIVFCLYWYIALQFCYSQFLLPFKT